MKTNKMEIPKEIEDFKEEAFPILQKYGYISDRKKKGLVWFAIILLWIASLTTFYYAGYQGWFKDNINQNVAVEPQINNTMNNEYKFSTPIDNNYYNNYTINVQIPQNMCG